VINELRLDLYVAWFSRRSAETAGAGQKRMPRIREMRQPRLQSFRLGTEAFVFLGDRPRQVPVCLNSAGSAMACGAEARSA
jgi:hypothetical protein